MGIPRAAEADSIHIHVQVSQDKKVKLAPMQYQKNLCAVRCPQESLHIWHLGMVGTSNGYEHLTSIQQPQGRHFIVVGKKSFLPKSLFHVPHSPAELQKQQTLKIYQQLSSLKLL